MGYEGVGKGFVFVIVFVKVKNISVMISFQVGGKWNHLLGRVEKPFQGVIAGLVLNKVSLELLQP